MDTPQSTRGLVVTTAWMLWRHPGSQASMDSPSMHAGITHHHNPFADHSTMRMKPATASHWVGHHRAMGTVRP